MILVYFFWNATLNSAYIQLNTLSIMLALEAFYIQTSAITSIFN